MATKEGNPTSISALTIKNLFGRFSYNVPPESTKGADLSKLFIIYGDNGSGKTTILNILFHMLSPGSGEGHRTFLAQTPFSSCTVKFANGIEVTVEKENNSLLGSFTYTVKNENSVNTSFYYKADAENVIKAKAVDEPEEQHFLAALRNLKVNIYHLSADRKFGTSLTGKIQSEEKESLTVWHETTKFALMDKPEPDGLETAVNRVVEWFRQKALRGANMGEANTNTIYTQIINQIAHPRSKKAPRTKINSALVLNELSKRNESYSYYGLTTPLLVGEILKTIKECPKSQLPVLHSVLDPFITSVKARLDALEEVQVAVSTFIQQINAFYSYKSISFNLRDGLTVSTDKGTLLNLGALSSGEKQLLLLFCHTIIARDQNTIIVIDEPEISLNVKWQRGLIPALLNCAGKNPIQFLFATHSIELLAKDRDHVAKLMNIDA